MTDPTTYAAGATLKLSEKTIQSLRDSWRAAGGVTYSTPKGQTAAMAEPKLFAFLAEFMLEADRIVDRGAPMADLSLRLNRAESELFHLVKAICPGLDSGDLFADSGVARAAMASAEPAAFFGVDEESLADGSPRFLQIAAQHHRDDDVFPLYRRAPTVAELATHIDRHQAADDVKASADGKPAADQAEAKATPAVKKAGTK